MSGQPIGEVAVEPNNAREDTVVALRFDNSSGDAGDGRNWDGDRGMDVRSGFDSWPPRAEDCRSVLSNRSREVVIDCPIASVRSRFVKAAVPPTRLPADRSQPRGRSGQVAYPWETLGLTSKAGRKILLTGIRQSQESITGCPRLGAYQCDMHLANRSVSWPLSDSQ